MDNKKVLALELATDPRWVNLAEMSLEDILTDHAYCEQKAAISCISLISKYPEKELLIEQLAPVVSEEWAHFRQVLRELKKRGLKLGWQRKDLYVNQLLKFGQKTGNRDADLLDPLIICAMIEARSCERFRLLSLHISDAELREFYHQFMVAEAAHYKLFLGLAEHYFGAEISRQRWKACLKFEAELLANMEIRADRMH